MWAVTVKVVRQTVAQIQVVTAVVVKWVSIANELLRHNVYNNSFCVLIMRPTTCAN